MQWYTAIIITGTLDRMKKDLSSKCPGWGLFWLLMMSWWCKLSRHQRAWMIPYPTQVGLTHWSLGDVAMILNHHFQTQAKDTGPCWWYIGSDDGPDGTKPLSEPMLPNYYDTIMSSTGANELTNGSFSTCCPECQIHSSNYILHISRVYHSAWAPCHTYDIRSRKYDPQLCCGITWYVVNTDYNQINNKMSTYTYLSCHKGTL